jgi:hypothetical protein
VATGRASALRREPALEVDVDGTKDLALVDLAVSTERFIGARALWRGDSITELFVTHARPSAVGLSAIAGRLAPGAVGVHVKLGGAPSLRVPLAPGLITEVGVTEHRLLQLGEAVAVPPALGCLALDGEREIERTAHETVIVRLIDGPRRIDIDAVMYEAAAQL